MINHLRTLLLNEGPDESADLEQYIDPNFKPLRLPGDAAAFRNEALRTTWPRDYKNFVATQLCRLAYSSRFAHMLNDLDPRITFDLNDTVAPIRDRITLTRYGGGSSLGIVGRFVPAPDIGLFAGEWDILRSSSSEVSLMDLRTGIEDIREISFNGDVSELSPIDGRSPFYFQFVGSSVVPVGLRARVKAFCAMPVDLSGLLIRCQANPLARQVLLIEGQVDLSRSLSWEFQNSTRLDQKLGALLIAFAVRASQSIT